MLDNEISLGLKAILIGNINVKIDLIIETPELKNITLII